MRQHFSFILLPPRYFIVTVSTALILRGAYLDNPGARPSGRFDVRTTRTKRLACGPETMKRRKRRAPACLQTGASVKMRPFQRETRKGVVAGAVFTRPYRNGREDLIRDDVEVVLTMRVVTRSPVGTRSTASDVLAFQTLFLKSTMPV